LWDRFHTLWASWAVEQRPYGDGYSASNPASLDKSISKIWFGGDTGLRSVPIGKKQEEMPICPVFKQIGERFGRFDLAVSFKLVSHVHILTPNQFFLFS
jgi:N-acyl-phosphatidylethanolamine-hydrolysing phospholipase D